MAEGRAKIRDAATVLGFVAGVLSAGTLHQIVVLDVPWARLGPANFVTPTLVGLTWGILLVALRRSRDAERELARRLAANERSLAAANSQLEERVAERTRELELANAELAHSQRLEAVGRVAGSVAHDFNNMLSIVSMSAEQLRSRLEGDDDATELVDEVVEASGRASAICSQLLLFSRKQPVPSEVVDLAELVRALRPLLERLLGAETRLVAEAAESARVRSDRGQLEQVLVNLAKNAKDAGAKTVRLSIASARPGSADGAAPDSPGAALITIADDGDGMTEEVREKCLEPFFTTKPAGEGTGLGLSASFGIVKSAGGALELTSAPGRGTTVRITLPRAS
jgi:signal transduction histidine kinase